MALVPGMVKRGGSIVNLSSVSGVVGTPQRAAYAATKGAIDAATPSLAVELGPTGMASDATPFVTGETVCADGGMARTLDLYAGPV